MSDNRNKGAGKRGTALVTGSRRGIGRAVALTLARSGYNVVLNGTTGGLERTLVREVECAGGGRATYIQADISLREDRESLLRAALNRFSPITLLVNNAGMAPSVRRDVLDTREASFDSVLGVNLRGTFFLTQRIARAMIKQIRSGIRLPHRIVTITSISAYASSPARAEYCISKAGLSMLTRLFADRLANEGIQVVEIRPGIIATDMTASVRRKYSTLIRKGLTPLRRWGTPEDVARAVEAVATGALSFSTGEVLNVDGGFHLHRL